MMSVIVAKAGRPYLRGMPVLLRLLALVALLLMPFAMGPSPAAAAPGAHAGAGTMHEGHCTDCSEHDSGKAAISLHCSAACTALPAESPGAPALMLFPRAMPDAQLVHGLAGAIPPPATPPPRLG